MQQIIFQPIGMIRTPFQTCEGMPIQPRGARSNEGQVVLDTTFAEGLNDIDGFSHLILIYHFHKSEGYRLTVKPFLDDRDRGVFATRAPRRPNAVGLSVVSLLGRQGHVLRVGDIDVVDRTPLLDIKPFVPAFDAPVATAIGWLDGKAEQFRVKRADDRFSGR